MQFPNSFGYDISTLKHTIDRDTLLIPEIYLEEYSSIDNLATILKPAFDAVWNAAGWPGSKNYDKNGKWTLEK